MTKRLIKTQNFGNNTLQLFEYKAYAYGDSDFKFEYTDSSTLTITELASFTTAKLKRFARDSYDETYDGQLQKMDKLFNSLWEFYYFKDLKSKGYTKFDRWEAYQDDSVKEIFEFIGYGKLFHLTTSPFSSDLYFYNDFRIDDMPHHLINKVKGVKEKVNMIVVERPHWASSLELNLGVYSANCEDIKKVTPLYAIQRDRQTAKQINELIGYFSQFSLTPNSIIENFFNEDYAMFVMYQYPKNQRF